MGLINNYASTLYEWLSGFAPTYREPVASSLFDEEHPQPNEYITYSADAGNFASEFMQAITIYSTSTSWTYIMDIVDEIETAVGENGIILRKEWGYITIHKGNPFYQDKPDEDDSVRAGYVNLIINIYQKNV